MDYATKLKNFPSINYPSLKTSQARRDHMQSQLNRFGLTKSNCLLTEPYSVTKDQYKVNCWYTANGYPEYCSHGINIAFLTLIKEWYDREEEEYAIFIDDDTDISTIDYWSFTWDDFVANLPKDWECVQLLRENHWDADTYVKHGIEEIPSLTLKEKRWDDFGSFFMLKRSHAKKILDRHYVSSNEFNMDIVQPDRTDFFLYPIIENIIYKFYGTIYNFPLFLEAVQFLDSSLNMNMTSQESEVYQRYYKYHIHSYEYYKKLWVETGLDTRIEDMMKL